MQGGERHALTHPELEYAVHCWKRLALVLAGALALALLIGVSFVALYVRERATVARERRQAEENFRVATEAVDRLLTDIGRRQPGTPQP